MIIRMCVKLPGPGGCCACRYQDQRKVDTMKLFSISQVFDLEYEKKYKIVETVMLALGVGFEVVSKNVPEMQKEISDWEDGRVFSLAVMHGGPAVSMKKENGVIKYLGKGVKDGKLVLYFKNIDSALMVFTGLMGAHTAAVQRRTIVHGNIGQSVQAVRAMAIVQKYLLPEGMVRKNSKRPPQLSFNDRMRKVVVITGLLPGLALKSSK